MLDSLPATVVHEGDAGIPPVLVSVNCFEELVLELRMRTAAFGVPGEGGIEDEVLD